MASTLTIVKTKSNRKNVKINYTVYIEYGWLHFTSKLSC